LGHADPVKSRPVAAAATAGALLVGALAGLAACGQNSGCVHTAISVSPVRVAAADKSLHLPAKLTSDGKPLARFRLAFSLVLTGPTQLVGKSGKTGRLLGYAMTGADGVATYTIPDGLNGVVLPKERAVGYEAGLTTANPINGKQYCDVHEDATLR
jgi:hypothetical protein